MNDRNEGADFLTSTKNERSMLGVFKCGYRNDQTFSGAVIFNERIFYPVCASHIVRQAFGERQRGGVVSIANPLDKYPFGRGVVISLYGSTGFLISSMKCHSAAGSDPVVQLASLWAGRNPFGCER